MEEKQSIISSFLLGLLLYNWSFEAFFVVDVTFIQDILFGMCNMINSTQYFITTVQALHWLQWIFEYIQSKHCFCQVKNI